MKKINTYISEKLIINKDIKNIDGEVNDISLVEEGNILYSRDNDNNSVYFFKIINISEKLITLRKLYSTVYDRKEFYPELDDSNGKYIWQDKFKIINNKIKSPYKLYIWDGESSIDLD